MITNEFISGFQQKRSMGFFPRFFFRLLRTQWEKLIFHIQTKKTSILCISINQWIRREMKQKKILFFFTKCVHNVARFGNQFHSNALCIESFEQQPEKIKVPNTIVSTTTLILFLTVEHTVSSARNAMMP